MAEAYRRKLLDRVVADHMLISGSHFPWPGLAKITKDGGSYAYTTLRTAWFPFNEANLHAFFGRVDQIHNSTEN